MWPRSLAPDLASLLHASMSRMEGGVGERLEGLQVGGELANTGGHARWQPHAGDVAINDLRKAVGYLDQAICTARKKAQVE